MAQPAATLPAADSVLANVLCPKKGVSLTIKTDSLVVKDTDPPKRHRNKLCGWHIGSSPSEIAIPLYNILWASVGLMVGTTRHGLVIDYALEKSKTKLRPAKLAYALNDVAPEIAQKWVQTLINHAYGEAEELRRAKVIINPHAGPGGAVQVWLSEVKPLFDAAKMTLDVETTTRGGQGVEICQNMDIEKFDVVIVCSGDGLAYEAFNGFGKRADARTALQQVAIAHIPCGSGNAMSLNLNGSPHPSLSALAVIKGRRTPVDLMSLTYGSERILSFLSQSVGIIAECDLGTENMRWLGAARFDVGVIQRIFTKRVYPCDVSYKIELENKDQIKSHYKQHRNREGPNNSAPGAGENAGEGLPPLRFGTVNDELPGDWEKHSYDKMGSFYCGNMAWMAPDANFFPAACIDDGMMDVAINDGNLSPVAYAALMMSVASGEFFDNPALSYRKVVAYRFTPRDQADGYISIDGERIPFGPFQVEVHPGLGTVLSKNGRYEAFGPPGWEEAN